VGTAQLLVSRAGNPLAGVYFDSRWIL